MIATVSQHTEFKKETVISATNFISLSADNGGGFLVQYDIKLFVENCYFYLCNATTRGGAYLITNGNCKIRFSCSNRCNSPSGDIVLWTPKVSHVDNIQCSNSVCTYHTSYFSSYDCNMQNVNLSYEKITEASNYGSGVSFSTNLYSLKFFNLIGNMGSDPVIRIEYTTFATAKLLHFNIINNKNANYIIYFLNAKIPVTFENSFFYGNTGSIMGYNAAGSSIRFNNCKLDFQPNVQGFVFDKCSYNTKMTEYISNAFGCFFMLYCSQTKKLNAHTNRLPILFYLFSISSSQL